MKVQILQVLKNQTGRASKDTNGGYGTVNEFGTDIFTRLLMMLKNKTMNYPEIQPAYISAILKSQGHSVSYAVNKVDTEAEIILIPTSIVNFKLEREWGNKIKSVYPDKRVGYVGGMVTGNPDLYKESGDFWVSGEPENILKQINWSQINGEIQAGLVKDLNELPFPDWDHIPQNSSYGIPGLLRGTSYPVLASRGCPMSCRYYCTYPLVQGAKFRTRSPENIIDELIYLRRRYKMENVLFRDPIFTLDMPRIEYLTELIIAKGLKFRWVCETHPKYLSPSLIQKMAQSGCEAIKIGIESKNSTVMNKSKRIPPELSYQENIIRTCEKNGIAILGFYILGYFDDTLETIEETLEYAKHLNTYGAQFTIATPYPGTPWYETLHAENTLFELDQNLENYTQYQLVYNHPELSKNQLNNIKQRAYKEYYFRGSYLVKNILRLRKT